MKRSFFKLCAICAATVMNGTIHAAGVASTFDTDADGWYVSDYLGVGTASATWISGVIQTIDQFSETSFHAPAKFNGNWSSLYGSTLSFDLTEVGRDANADDYHTAVIASGNKILYWYGGAPSTSFTTFVATLSTSDTRWRLGGSGFSPTSGVAPTEADFLAVLSNVTRLQINGEFITGPDDTRLDNVVLGAVPEPGNAALYLIGLAAVAGAVRQSSRRSQEAPTP